ncbi:hypothetical protein GS458_0546 [Geobacillus stearothermophilus]|nr:hypothetical protein GS458_0546 [Geobacillus stearothermophilus]
MPKIGHLCFPIAFFGHFQYTLTDQERIPHSPSGGDFHGKKEKKSNIHTKRKNISTRNGQKMGLFCMKTERWNCR